MIYRAIQLIQIFLAHERTNERTDEGVPRGPRRPKKSVLQSLKYFVTLVRDELKTKYLGLRFQKYASCPLEAAAVHWLRTEMGWTQTIPERIPR